MNEKTCGLNYEAEYNRLIAELEKAKCKNDHLCELLHKLERENVRLKAIKATIEVVFGRSFDNEKTI